MRVAPGELYLADLGEPHGNRQAGLRPVLVISSELYNRLPIEMSIVVPLTGRDRGLPTQPRITATERSGLEHDSWARPEDVTALPRRFLVRRLGAAVDAEIADVCEILRRFITEPPSPAARPER